MVLTEYLLLLSHQKDLNTKFMAKKYFLHLINEIIVDKYQCLSQRNWAN